MFNGPPHLLAWEEICPPSELFPMNDIRQHEPGMKCWCCPEVNETMTIIHNALDRREEFMEGHRKPS
jgi:hypothetical protein